MSDFYEEYGLEEEALPPDPTFPPEKEEKVIVKKKGGWLGRILALVLGVVIGIGACVGGVYYAISSPVQSVLSLANVDYEAKVKDKILSEKYGDKTILEIAKATASAAGAKKLSGLNAIFPFIGNFIDDISGDAENSFGIKFETQTLLETPFTDLAPYLFDTVKTTPLANILDATNGDKSLEPVLLEICYGEEGEDYTYDANGNIVLTEGITPATIETLSGEPTAFLGKISVASVAHPSTNDPLLLSVCYGKEDVTFYIAPDATGKDTVYMHQLFLTKNEDGKFVDYNGQPILADLTTLDDGFIKVVQYRADAASEPVLDSNGNRIVKHVYYVKDDGTGTYYAYKEPKAGAEPALFKKNKVMDLQDDSQSLINNIYLKDALHIEPNPFDPEQDPHAILFGLAYGEKDVDYEIIVNADGKREIKMLNGAPRTIGDLRNDSNSLINNVFISDFMEESHDDAVIMYLLYGKEDIHFEIDDNDVVRMKQQFIALRDFFGETHVYNAYGEFLQEKAKNPDGTYDMTSDGYMLDETKQTYIDSHGVTYYYKAADPEATIPTEQGPGKIYYLFEDEARTKPVKFKKHTLADLSGEEHLISYMDRRLTIGEILGEESTKDNFLFKHVADSTITNLPDAIAELTFGEVFENDIYYKYLPEDEAETYVDANGVTVKHGDYTDQEGNYVTEENRVVKGEWKYLLRNDQGEIDEDYKVASDMGKLLSNMTNNITQATMQELTDDGMISFNQETLNTPIRKEFMDISLVPTNFPTDKTKLGDCTAAELLDYVAAVLVVMEFLEATH
ncbi:MAG: hypothetical protein E7377_00615 [Clostridiales bacterium]|nr:hypothetical protein [Clostridiales bacterium]